MTTEMALTTRTSLGPVRRLAMVLTVSVLAGLGSVAIAPAASADDSDDVAVVVQDDDGDAEDDDAPEVIKDGPNSVVHRAGRGGPDAFILRDHGRRAVFFCDVRHAKKQHNNCTAPLTQGPRF